MSGLPGMVAEAGGLEGRRARTQYGGRSGAPPRVHKVAKVAAWRARLHGG